MKINSAFTPFAAGLLALASFAVPAQADMKRIQAFPRHDVARPPARQDFRSSRHEIRQHRAEVNRDRANLRRFYRHGVSRGAIARKRAEIRQDIRGIKQHRRGFHGGYSGYYKGHRYYNHRSHGRFGARHGWHRNDHGRWRRGWGYRR